MGTLVTEAPEEQAVDALGVDVFAEVVPEPLKKKFGKITIKKASLIGVAEKAKASGGDLIGDAIHKIESMGKSEALARVGELEEVAEKSYFEIGGVLSVIQREKWFEPCASFDEWIELNTGMKRSKARALVQIYDKIVASEVKWHQVKDIGWTKVRVIARVLDKENANHWIGIASKHNKPDLIEAVKQYFGVANAGGSTDFSINFKVHSGQKTTIEAAIDKAKAACNTDVATVALEHICVDYIGGQTPLQERLAALGPDALAKTFADALNAISKDSATAVIKSVHQSVSHDIDLESL